MCITFLLQSIAKALTSLANAGSRGIGHITVERLDACNAVFKKEQQIPLIQLM